MDLHNNGIGILVYHENANGTPDVTAIENELLQRYNNGEMYIWEIPTGAPNSSGGASEGILIRSDGGRIFNP